MGQHHLLQQPPSMLCMTWCRCSCLLWVHNFKGLPHSKTEACLLEEYPGSLHVCCCNTSQTSAAHDACTGRLLSARSSYI